MRYLVLFLCLLIQIPVSTGCKTEYGRSVQPAFYYWKDKFDISPREQAYLEQLCVEKIYLRFFDVDWNPKRRLAVPISSVVLDPRRLQDREMVPTIFITTRTLDEIASEHIPILAKQIYTKIKKIAGEIPFREIQLDCDWTTDNQMVYFSLIAEIRNLANEKNIQLSSTIRLHQLRFFQETGVPPVDRGMLMVYNGEGTLGLKGINSILDTDLVSEYLTDVGHYPLKIDLALPLFSWGVVIRNQKTVHLLEHLYSDQLEHTDKFKFIDPELIQVLQDCYLNGFYLRAGDIIRMKDVSMEQLFDAAELLAPMLPSDSLYISFYHLDTPTINRYAYKNLEMICRMFD